MNGEILCIIPGPSEVIFSEPDDRERWCFKCRHRHVHQREVLADPFPSWYDPVSILRCPHCHNDYTRFPGSTPT